MSVGGCGSLKVDTISVVTQDDWRQDSGTPSRDRVVSTEFSFPLEKAWHINVGAAFGPSSPLLVGPTLIVGTRRGDLYAVGTERGEKVGSKRFGEAIEGNILIEREVVYIPSFTGKENMTAYDLTEGKKLWAVQGVPFKAGLVSSKNVLVGVDIGGVIWGRNLTSGEELWSFKMEDGSSGQTTPLVLADGSIVVAGDQGLVIALDPENGTILWSTALDEPVYASPSASGDLIFVPTTTGVLLALHQKNGLLIWRTRLGHDEVKLTSAGIDRQDLYVGTSDGQFLSLNAFTGEIKWRFDGPHSFSSPPLITRKYVLVGTLGRKLYAFDRVTARLTWETELDGRIKSAMAARNGELFVLAEPRHIYKFKSREVPDEAID